MTTYDTILMYCAYIAGMGLFTFITAVSDAEGNTTMVLRFCRRVTIRHKLRVIVFIVVILLWPLPALELVVRGIRARFRRTRGTE